MSQNHPSFGSEAAVLQSYNNEMVKCIEDLCSRRDELKRQIESDQEERTKVHSDIKLLTNRLATLNEGIAQKMTSQNEFDKAILETQAAYTRVMNSSQALLQSIHGTVATLKSKEGISDQPQDSTTKLPKFAKKVQIQGANWGV